MIRRRARHGIGRLTAALFAATLLAGVIAVSATRAAQDQTGDVNLCPDDRPCIVELYVSDGVVEVGWFGNWDKYNIEVSSPGMQKVQQYDYRRDSWGFRIPDAGWNRTYSVGVQGCHTSFLGVDLCTGWASRDIYVERPGRTPLPPGPIQPPAPPPAPRVPPPRTPTPVPSPEPPRPPQTPLHFSAELNEARDAVLLAWVRSDGASYYELSVSNEDSDFARTTRVADWTPDDYWPMTYYDEIGPNRTGDFVYELRACNADGCSAPISVTVHL